MQPKATEIKSFFYSQAFTDGFRAAFAILTPAIIGYRFDFFQQGLAISLGAMCTSLSDAPGPITHKRNGMVAAGLTAFLMAAVTGFARLNGLTLGIEIAIACFFFSMFNVFGTRATSVGNCGMMMMILTMDVDLLPPQVLPHALLVLAGSAYYTILSLGLHALRPYRTAQRALGDCVQEIAKYLAIRGDFYDPSVDLDENYRKVVKQQIVVHEKQEALRELLFKTRQIVEETTTEGRRLVFYFVETVDLFERITAASFDYDMLRTRLSGTALLPLLHRTITQAAKQLDQLGKAMESGARYERHAETDSLLQRLRQATDQAAAGGRAVQIPGRLLVNIRQLLHDIDKLTGYFKAELPQRQNRLDSSRFVTVTSYHPAQLWTNIHFHSTVFRHAVRVAAACVGGFAVSKMIGYGHHSYWILLTIAFILKPAFSLT
ncbi:MAG TPA: FUSC family membrane protein, partial [Chitinophagaceae bacterium]